MLFCYWNNFFDGLWFMRFSLTECPLLYLSCLCYLFIQVWNKSGALKEWELSAMSWFGGIFNQVRSDLTSADIYLIPPETWLVFLRLQDRYVFSCLFSHAAQQHLIKGESNLLSLIGAPFAWSPARAAVLTRESQLWLVSNVNKQGSMKHPSLDITSG